MGFREVLLCLFVLLLTASDLSAALQNFNSSTNETTSSQLPRSVHTMHHQSLSGPVRSPVSYRLKVYQIWNPAVQKQKPVQEHVEQSFPIPQVSEGGGLTSEQLEAGENVQVQELIQGPDLSPPVLQEYRVQVKSVQQVPVPADSVAVRCGEGKVTVEVKQNFLGNGQLICPGDLTLGGCPAEDAAESVVMFQAELQSCGSTLTMTEEALIYSFTLTYSPTPINSTLILKTNQAEVLIQCHYRRKHHVSSGAMRPTWSTFASSTAAEQQLHFSLRLMTEDWQAQRSSRVFFLSDVMHMEAAVRRGHHVPMRVFVDSCVATVTSDPESQPGYQFITNHGCLTDAKLTGGKSYFMQRSSEDKLHFQLKAFRFDSDHRNSLYITCHLKATTLSVPIGSRLKACSYLTEAKRWVASGGDNNVCECCSSSCSEQRSRRSPEEHGVVSWDGTAALGPILLELLPDPAPLLQETTVTPAASSSSLLVGAASALVLVLLVLMGAVVWSKGQKPKEHNVCS